MITYPMLFSANAQSISGIQSSWSIESQNITNQCAIPPEFEGPGGALSPEDLFAQALTGCFLATFKVFAEKSRIDFAQVSAQAELTVDLDDNKKPVMKRFVLHALITGCDKPDRVRSVAERAFSSGFILNSVKTELHLELNISG